jgi:hypothetical protein
MTFNEYAKECQINIDIQNGIPLKENSVTSEIPDFILEGIIKMDFKLPKNFDVSEYYYDNVHELSFEYFHLGIIFYISKKDARFGYTEAGRYNNRIYVNLHKANTKSLIERTINHELIHRIQLEKSQHKDNISRIKSSLKGDLTNDEKFYIDYGNYFELMAYAYTFADSGIELGYSIKEIIKQNEVNSAFKELLKLKKFKKYLYWYYEYLKEKE